MSMLTAKLRQLAGQEGHDGEPWDSMSEAADELDRLERELAEAQENFFRQIEISNSKNNKIEIEQQRAEKAESQVKVLVEALERLDTWINAYPLAVFPEPDLKRAHKILKTGGMGLDAISASNMRHVLNGMKDIVQSALASIKEPT